MAVALEAAPSHHKASIWMQQHLNECHIKMAIEQFKHARPY